MLNRLLFPCLALALLACNRSAMAPTTPDSGSAQILDLKTFQSYRGFIQEGGYRKGIVLETEPGTQSDSIWLWAQKATETQAVIEWSAKSGNLTVDSVGPGTQRVILKDVRYERSIGAEGLRFPSAQLELRLTRITGDMVNLEFTGPAELPEPLPFNGGGLRLVKDFILE